MEGLRVIRIIVEDAFKVDLEKINRTRRYVNARACYYTLCKKYIREASLYLIGKEVGKNHATVIHGLNNAGAMRKYDGYITCWKISEQKTRQVLGEEKLIVKNKDLVSHFSQRYDILQKKNMLLMNKIIALSDCKLNKIAMELDPNDLDDLIETRIKPYVAMRKKQTA